MQLAGISVLELMSIEYSLCDNSQLCWSRRFSLSPTRHLVLLARLAAPLAGERDVGEEDGGRSSFLQHVRRARLAVGLVHTRFVDQHV